VQEGKRIRTTLLEVRAIASPLVHLPGSRTRVGLVVPRYRQSAVARNRVKRRLRELSRMRLLPSDVAADIVIRIRAEAYDAPFSALAVDVDRVLRQLLQWRSSTPDPVSEPSNATTDRVLPDT
jgi:ribonuclease P protein component